MLQNIKASLLKTEIVLPTIQHPHNDLLSLTFGHENHCLSAQDRRAQDTRNRLASGTSLICSCHVTGSNDPQCSAIAFTTCAISRSDRQQDIKSGGAPCRVRAVTCSPARSHHRCVLDDHHKMAIVCRGPQRAITPPS